jgi:hypothetical protein
MEAVGTLPPPGYPVRVEFDENEPINRLWGIPIFGHFVRALILVPHFLVLAMLGTLAGLLQFVVWYPVLLQNRYPQWGYDLVGGTYRYAARVSAYWLMLTDTYPPFWVKGEHPVTVDYDETVSINPLWGIPLFGIWLRGILAIPHYIVLALLAIGVWFVLLVSWIPVLIDGRMATWGYTMLGGLLRWTTRVTAYVLLLTSVYPPFRLRD